MLSTHSPRKFAISSLTSSTLILNWISREVSKKIRDNSGCRLSSIHPDGFDLPIDVIEMIFWNHFLPEWRYHQVLPVALRQDIYLLSQGLTGHIQDIITTQPISVNDEGIHGTWLIPTSTEPRGIRWCTRSGVGEFVPAVSGKTDYQFGVSGSSKDPEEVYGSDHTKIFQKFMDQTNWSKVDILNHIRSVKCPILGLDESGDYMNSTMISSGDCDYMELRELTASDVLKRASVCSSESRHIPRKDHSVSLFSMTKQHDKLILTTKLEEIITNNKEMERQGYRRTDGPGTANGIIWHPGINCPGKVTFTTR